MWLANTCRFLHLLKQYSGEKAFQVSEMSMCYTMLEDCPAVERLRHESVERPCV